MAEGGFLVEWENMNKKIFLILLIIPLTFFILNWRSFSLFDRGEPLDDLVFLVYRLPIALLFYAIEIFTFFLFRKFLSKKLNDYQLVIIIFIISFIILLVIGDFDGLWADTAYLTKNLSFCRMVSNNHRDVCILHTVVEISDESLCEEKVEESWRNNCYSAIAERKKDPNLCEKISNLEKKDSCYLFVATRAKQLDICSKISDQTLKEFCLTGNFNPKSVACTQEAKICPDGSTVSRSGPNCEFAECPVVTDETADWKTYSNLWINFVFKYPGDWAIEDEYQYKSAACQFDPKCTGVRYIFLNKISDTRQPSLGEKEKFGIAINMPQCAGVKRDNLPGNNWICLFDENLETLDIYEKIKNSFKLVKDLTADWKNYRNEEYGFEINYPSALSYKEKQGGLFGIEYPEINLWLRVERKPEDFSDLKSYVTAIADAGNSKCEADLDFPGYSACTYSVKSQNFGNKNTFAILESPNWGNASAMGATTTEVYFENGNYLFIASYYYNSIFLSGSQEMSEDVETYNTTQRYNTIQQMLSTLKFIK